MSKRRTITRRLAAKLLFRFKYACQACSAMVDDLHEFDHVVPLWAGGADHEDNLQLLCYACHGRKTRDESDLYTAYRRAVKSLHLPSERVCWKCTTVYSKYFEHECPTRGCSLRPTTADGLPGPKSNANPAAATIYHSGRSSRHYKHAVTINGL